MFGRTVDIRTRRDQARLDLSQAEAALAELDAAKAQATASRQSFEKWRADHAATTIERERLVLLLQTLEDDLVRSDAADADKELRKQYAEKVAANAELARRITSELKTANSVLMNLIRDVAVSVKGDQAINSRLPSDLTPVVSADFLARSQPALPREEIGHERLLLWARADNGALVGDQDAVEDRGEKGGEIRRVNLAPIRCQRMLFEQVSFHPAEPATRPEPLWQMRLVSVDGGVEFDGTDLVYAHEVLAAHARWEQAKEPRERPLQSEIVPIPVIAVREEA